jgi:hypothetical protein
MRYVVLALVLAVCGCAHQVAHFRPALPEEAVPGQPEAATGEAAGVRVTVRAGDWRGAPDDLENALTPVEVYLENESGKAIRVDSQDFGLIAPDGFRYQALDPRDVQRFVASRYPRDGAFYYGFFGAYPWPGFWRPWRHRFYPYVSFGWYGPPGYWGPPPTAPPGPQPGPGPSGTLENGGNVSVLLFFQVPALSLPKFDLTADLVDTSGAKLGTLRLPLVRQDGSPR